MLRCFRRAALVLTVAAALAGAILAASATPASAYGKANWQIAFAGTATQPGVGGLGFWGWCDFAGGASFNSAGQATSGSSGDCEYAVYVHNVAFTATCHESLDLNGWYISDNGDFFMAGTATVTPVAQTPFCESFPGDPSSSTFSNFDSLIPAFAGHLNLNGLLSGGIVFNQFQIQETALP
jgi:hypothetical protein